MMKRNTISSEQLEARLKQLPDTVDHALKSLTADEALKRRIERAVMTPERETVRRPVYRSLVPAMALALVLVVGAAVGIPALRQSQPDRLITSQAAGSPTDMEEHRDSSELGQGRVMVSTTNAPAYRSLWEGSAASFPLIGVNGSYYRMMTEPASVSKDLLGDSLGGLHALSGVNRLSRRGRRGRLTLPVAVQNGLQRVFPEIGEQAVQIMLTHGAV